MSNENFVKLLTPSGHAAIAVFQVSGKKALSVVDQTLLLKGSVQPSERDLGKIHFGYWHHLFEGDKDEVVTGGNQLKEDVVYCRTEKKTAEIHFHSSPAVVQSVQRRFEDAAIPVEIDSKESEPGKELLQVFRWLNEKCRVRFGLTDPNVLDGHDVAEKIVETLNRKFEAVGVKFQISSEAVWKHQLVAIEGMKQATTTQIASIFMDQVNGGLWDFLFQLTDGNAKKDSWNNSLGLRLNAFTEIQEINDPVELLFFGQPNVGKSSLINTVVGFERAIVSEIPGTTRDLIHQQTVIDGIPFRIYDSAGIRSSTNEIENKGISKTNQAVESIENRFMILQPSQLRFVRNSVEIEETDDLELEYQIVLNKIDLLTDGQLTAVKKQFPHWIFVSAEKQIGLPNFLNKIRTTSNVHWNKKEIYRSVPLNETCRQLLKGLVSSDLQ